MVFIMRLFKKKYLSWRGEAASQSCLSALHQTSRNRSPGVNTRLSNKLNTFSWTLDRVIS